MPLPGNKVDQWEIRQLAKTQQIDVELLPTAYVFQINIYGKCQLFKKSLPARIGTNQKQQDTNYCILNE